MARIKHPKNYAWFTPSVSQMFVLAHAKGWPRQPFPFDKLNFMDEVNSQENGGMHFWPANLYSAGHAHLEPSKSNDREKMIQGRVRENSVLVGDSGGFQAATGVLEFDWDNPLGETANRQRIELLRWLEHTADYSMVLDWPAWAIPTGRLPPQLKSKNPATGAATNDKDPDATFENCLAGTVWNNHFFVNNRAINEDSSAPTKFLNVLQGRTEKQAFEWYDRVTPFSDKKWVAEQALDGNGERAFEGWALGGATGGDPSITMKLLVKLRRDGHLNGPDRWIHVLGRSRLSTAAYLAALNESLSRNLNPGIQISYDASSAFLYAVNGNYVTDFACTPKGMNLISAEWPMHPKFIKQEDKVAMLERLKEKNPTVYNQVVGRYGLENIMEDAGAQPFLYSGVNEKRINHEDLRTDCAFQMPTYLPPHRKSPLSVHPSMRMDEFILAQEDGKENDKGFRMDTASYYYLMAHNVQMQCHAVEYVCDKLFAEDAANYVPPIFIQFKRDVDELFKTHKPWLELTQEEQDQYTEKSLAMCDTHFTIGIYGDLISGERLGFTQEDGVIESERSNDEALDKEAAERKEKRKKPAKVVITKPKLVDDGDLFSFNVAQG